MLGVPPTLQDGDTVSAQGGRLATTSERGAGLRVLLTGGILSFVGNFLFPRTQTFRDASGNLCLDTVNNNFTVTQQFNAAEAISLGTAATAGNGLVQLASGTTKASGIAFGTDSFLFRNTFSSLLSTAWFTCGDGTQSQSQILNGTNSGSGGGCRYRLQNAGTDVGQIGNTSGFLGGAYDATFGIASASALKFYSSYALAITIDTSQNVTAQVALTSLHPTAGVGYSAGAGGTVTQATSRPTGVTLNKVTGVITLVSAAGSVTWQSFTVTNSAVAATDTIICNQVSGTDLNMIQVTAVAAGSFRISFATTGGTTVEQPVFRFTLIKSVSA